MSQIKIPPNSRESVHVCIQKINGVLGVHTLTQILQLKQQVLSGIFSLCRERPNHGNLLPKRRQSSYLVKFFPTCQVRVVRFYVSLFSSSFSFSFSSASSSVSLSCCDSVCSVWHVGPQLRSCEFSVACWTLTAILRVQCGVPDPNRDPANSVWRPGPQPRSCEFSVASRTPTAILWVQCGVPDLKYCVRKFVRKNDRRYVRKNDRRYVRRNVKRICQKICQKECQKICQKDVRKNVRRYVRKNVKRYVRKNGKRYVRKNVRR